MKRLRTQTAFAALAILAILATESATAMPQNIAISSDGEPSVNIPIERMYAVALPSEVITDIKPLRKISTPITATPSERLVAAKEIDLPTEDSEVEKLAKLIPETIDEAEANIAPQRNRFLMWTHDLKHIMWGCFGNGYFVGADNLGERAWGIYGEKVFAGLYGGDFFWGFYGSGRWRAFGLFGERRTYGRYLTAKNS